MRDSTPGFGKALEKGLDLLERLAQSGTPLAFTELRSQLDASPASFARFLKILARRGYVQHDRTGRYRLGWRLAQLGQVVLDASRLRQMADPHLQAIRKATRETAELAEFQDGHFQFLARLESPQSILLRARPGSRFPVTSGTAIGILGLAYGLGGTEPLEAPGANAIRRACFAEGFQNDNEAYRAAAPLIDATGHCIACLVVAAPAFRMDTTRRRTNKKVLCAQARALSRLLGGVRDDEGGES